MKRLIASALAAFAFLAPLAASAVTVPWDRPAAGRINPLYQLDTVYGNIFVATSTSPSTFAGGLISSASSTLGNGTQAGGITIRGSATSTGDVIVGPANTGKVQISSSATFPNIQFKNGSTILSQMIQDAGGSNFYWDIPSIALNWRDTLNGGTTVASLTSGGVFTSATRLRTGTLPGNTYATEVGYNTNGLGFVRVTNASSGNGALAGYLMENNNGSTESMQVAKLSSGYTPSKILNPRDSIIYNSSPAGNIAILNDYASGKILMAAGGSSSAHLVISSAGNIGVSTSSPTNRLEVAGNTFLGGNLTATGTVTLSGATSTLTSGIVAPCFSTNGTSCITGGAGTSASSTLLADNNTFSGTNTFTSSGTTTYSAGVSANKVAASYFNATSSAATSTFNGGIQATCFSTNGTSCLSGGGKINITYITASSTWSVPTGVTQAFVEAVGGGAGGGDDSNEQGSGAGYSAKLWNLNSIPSLTIVIGSGGAGNSAAGSSGGATTVTDGSVTITANGGGVNSGGTASSGDFNVTGGTGAAMFTAMCISGVPFKYGTAGGNNSSSAGVAGVAGSGYGAGGCAALDSDGASTLSGASGRDGLAVITWVQ